MVETDSTEKKKQKSSPDTVKDDSEETSTGVLKLLGQKVAVPSPCENYGYFEHLLCVLQSDRANEQRFCVLEQYCTLRTVK